MKGFCIVNLNHSLIAKPLTLFPQLESRLEGIGELAFKSVLVLLSFAILFYYKGKTTIVHKRETFTSKDRAFKAGGGKSFIQIT